FHPLSSPELHSKFELRKLCTALKGLLAALHFLPAHSALLALAAARARPGPLLQPGPCVEAAVSARWTGKAAAAGPPPRQRLGSSGSALAAARLLQVRLGGLPGLSAFRRRAAGKLPRVPCPQQQPGVNSPQNSPLPAPAAAAAAAAGAALRSAFPLGPLAQGQGRAAALSSSSTAAAQGAFLCRSSSSNSGGGGLARGEAEAAGSLAPYSEDAALLCSTAPVYRPRRRRKQQQEQQQQQQPQQRAGGGEGEGASCGPWGSSSSASWGRSSSSSSSSRLERRELLKLQTFLGVLECSVKFDEELAQQLEGAAAALEAAAGGLEGFQSLAERSFKEVLNEGGASLSDSDIWLEMSCCSSSSSKSSSKLRRLSFSRFI
ncbi:hypothetical protein ETH_00041585, partial [Eimeria tenella]